MAVAHDAVSEHERSGTSTPSTGTHTPVGTPRGIICLIARARPGNFGTEDIIASVLYGGVPMTRIGGIVADTSGEHGQAYLYFLGSGIPTGPQTTTINYASADNHNVHATFVSVTAAKDTAVIDFDGIAGDQANPSRTLQYTGLTAIAYATVYSGTADPPTTVAPGTDCTSIATWKMPGGTYGGHAIRQTTPGTADFTIAFVSASDDVAMAAIAITEATIARISQDPVEVLVYPNPKATMSQLPTEALIGIPFTSWRPRVTFWWLE